MTPENEYNCLKNIYFLWTHGSGGNPHGASTAPGGESQPVSRVLSRTVIHLGQASPPASSDLPGPGAGHTRGSLCGLAPGGVYPATDVTVRAVRSYRTFSPLPSTYPRSALRPGTWALNRPRVDGRRYIFCGTFRRLAPPRRYLAPCPVEPGLSSPAGATARLTLACTIQDRDRPIQARLNPRNPRAPGDTLRSARPR